jgi:hypothetical protein
MKPTEEWVLTSQIESLLVRCLATSGVTRLKAIYMVRLFHEKLPDLLREALKDNEPTDSSWENYRLLSRIQKEIEKEQRAKLPIKQDKNSKAFDQGLYKAWSIIQSHIDKTKEQV